MKLTYQLSEHDYLNCHLFFTSRSESTIRARKRNRLMMAGIYVVLGVVTIYFGDPVLSGLLILAGILWYILFPGYEGKKIAARMRKHLQEQIRSQFDQETRLEITEDMIIDNVNNFESRIPTSEVKEICRVAGYYYLLTKAGIAIIIPRKILDEEEALITILKGICNNLKLPYSEYPEWQWK